MARQARCMMLNSCPINRGRYSLKSLLRVSALSFSPQAPKLTLKRRRPTNHSPLQKVIFKEI